ncbi:MAG: hypothetical protein V7746_17120 [Halioglobus sp.]
MKIPTYQWIGQMLAALGVTVSLALVAWELKQSRDLGMADLYHQTAAMTMEYQASVNQNEPLIAAMLQLYDDEALLTEEQVMRVHWSMDGWMYVKESIFYQHRLGVTPAKEWDTHENIIAEMSKTICYARRWKNYKSMEYNADFVVEVNRIWANLPEKECPFDSYD